MQSPKQFYMWYINQSAKHNSTFCIVLCYILFADWSALSLCFLTQHRSQVPHEEVITQKRSGSWRHATPTSKHAYLNESVQRLILSSNPSLLVLFFSAVGWVVAHQKSSLQSQQIHPRSHDRWTKPKDLKTLRALALSVCGPYYSFARESNQEFASSPCISLPVSLREFSFTSSPFLSLLFDFSSLPSPRNYSSVSWAFHQFDLTYFLPFSAPSPHKSACCSRLKPWRHVVCLLRTVQRSAFIGLTAWPVN